MINKVEWYKATCGRAHFCMHITYLTLVTVEAHGFYGIAAGVLGVVVIAEKVVEKWGKTGSEDHA